TPLRTDSASTTVVCPTRTSGTSTMALSWPVGIVPMTTPASRARGRSEACTVATANKHANTIRIRIARPPRDAPSLNEKGGPEAALLRFILALHPYAHAVRLGSTLTLVLQVLPQPLQRLQLRGDLGQALLGLGDLHLLAAVGEDALGLFLRRAYRGLVDVLGADRGVGQHRHHLRLHLEDAAGDREVELLAGGRGDHDLAGLEPGDQRGVARRDAELAHLAGGHDHGGLAGVDLGFGADDVAADCRCHVVSLSR